MMAEMGRMLVSLHREIQFSIWQADSFLEYHGTPASIIPYPAVNSLKPTCGYQETERIHSYF